MTLGVLVLLLSGASADDALVRVGDAAVLKRCELADCKVKAAPGPAWRLAFGCAQRWPNIKFAAERLGYPTDWSGAAMLAVTVSNPGREPVRVSVRVDSALDAKMGRQGSAYVEPGQTRRLLVPVDDSRRIIGMQGQPPLYKVLGGQDVVLSCNTKALDLKRMTRFQIFMGRPKKPHTVMLHKVELVRASTKRAGPFVDRFGQYNGADWPGKLHNEDELAERLRAEQAYFQAHPPLPGRNAYGGWRDGPQLKATGRFRVQKHEGKWWFVDPEGRLFWSSGVTGVKFNAATIVAGREHCYDWLPGKGDPLGRFYRGRGKRRMYDFFAANALRKYGPEFEKRFYETAMSRLTAWGLTTIANWSNPASWRLKRVPYVMPVHVPRLPRFVASTHLKAGLPKKKWFPDPFDPGFRAGLTDYAKRLAEYKDDPWLLGVFIDNELPWVLGAPPWRGGENYTRVGALVLAQTGGFKIKHAVVAHLRKRFESVEALNRAWGVTLAGWDEAAKPISLSPEQRRKADKDLAAIDALIAEQYFRVCKDVLAEHMPGVLYLGCRFSGMYTRAVVDVARRYCDVVSFNIYAERPSERTADELAMELDFPVVIGEFHFGALDRGMFHTGLRRAKDQTERAGKYAAYVREAAEAPWCVGVHWFQYLDQALTGRADGENYNIGFVDATDDPYPEMRDAARQVHAELYKIRAAKP